VALAAWPFLRAGLVDDDVFASAVTGSSGSGRTPSEGTHHPARHGDLRAYGWLAHRHEPEMAMLLGAARAGDEPDVAFVPHSGPFVRGIHATVRMTLKSPETAAVLASVAAEAYAEAPFVAVRTTPPRLIDVVGTNRCELGVAARGRTLVVASVIDNLAKGAAGGGIQWMNRQFGLKDDCGLALGGPGWF
jgi:N-acetyl-gamma-glutamyl-phosphate reductase